MYKPFVNIRWREGFRGTVVKVDRFCPDSSLGKNDQRSAGDLHISSRAVSIVVATLVALLLSGCIKRLAVNSLADALTEGSESVYARDDDPELVGEALPFALKTMEALVEQSPENKKLLISTASGFVQYAHAYVLQPAKELEATDLAKAREERQRAKRLFLRARGYGLRALERDYADISQHLITRPVAALSQTKVEDVPALYWTGVAWGSAISVAKDDMALVSDVPAVRALLDRTLELDPDWQDGAVHEFFIRFDAGRSEAEGGGIAKAEEHFARAMELNGGRSVAPLVALAESVCVRQQDRARFKALLQEALAFDTDKYPENRLANLLAQERASVLLDQIDELFFLDDAKKQTSVRQH